MKSAQAAEAEGLQRNGSGGQLRYVLCI